MSTIYLLTINLGLRIVGILQPATSGVPYAGTLYAYRGIAPYVWSLSPDSVALPAGLSISTVSDNGVISGTPTTPGTTDVIITVADATGLAVSRTARIVVL